MNKVKTNFFLTALLACGLMLFASCSSTPATNSNTAVVVSGDSVGVAECDEYIKKYEACLTKITKDAPQAAPGLKTGFDAQRKGFKDAATTPQGKAALATQCKQFLESAKTSTASYGCAW